MQIFFLTYERANQFIAYGCDTNFKEDNFLEQSYVSCCESRFVFICAKSSLNNPYIALNIYEACVNYFQLLFFVKNIL